MAEFSIKPRSIWFQCRHSTKTLQHVDLSRAGGRTNYIPEVFLFSICSSVLHGPQQYLVARILLAFDLTERMKCKMASILQEMTAMFPDLSKVFLLE